MSAIGGGGGGYQSASSPLVVPLAIKVGIGLAVLLVLNQVAPGIPQAVLVLVALYLVLQHSAEVAAIVSGASDSFGRTIRGS